MIGVDVTLDSFELNLALQVGGLRYVDCRVNGRKDRWHDAESGWTNHIEGAAGEIAAAKCLGLYWNGSINTFQSAGDVGSLQIRTRISPGPRDQRWRTKRLVNATSEAEREDILLEPYRLIVRDSDSDNDRFLLVISMMPDPVYRVVGWCYAADAKHERFVDDPGGLGRPAYFVPPNASIIQPLGTLSL